MASTEADVSTAGPAVKRQKLSGTSAAASDPVAEALAKIAGFISSPKKFHKASALLRQLLQDGKVTQLQGKLLFEALKASMLDPDLSCEPDFAKEYSKLFTAASKQALLFSMREQAQLDVYGLWAVIRNQLGTDDSFAFNKTLNRIKDSISNLPVADDEADSALVRVQERMQEEAAAAAAAPKQEQAVQEEPVEADPFGLDAIIAKPKRKERSQTWSEAESSAMKRQALMDCLEAAKGQYHNAWACTAVDLAIEEAYKHKNRFCASQQPTLETLWQFVGQQRQRRRMGPSARDAKRDAHSFEAARAQWGRATISNRAAVGAGGDHKNEVWLG
ncbi:hypothetical protein WJX73_010639 [Symbiochloris irregularis]|uniref:Uncharacterized protein n=1 Tax=Symbiochloris irregularis TaxID=706552 RepID=A0AAW1P0Q9_9CHLO